MKHLFKVLFSNFFLFSFLYDITSKECGDSLFSLTLVFTNLGSIEHSPMIPLIRGKLAFVRHDLTDQMAKSVSQALKEKIGDNVSTFECLAEGGGFSQKIVSTAVMKVMLGLYFLFFFKNSLSRFLHLHLVFLTIFCLVLPFILIKRRGFHFKK
jgi:hypothetical protein